MRAGLPTGTVTFLFTDIEGSTRLLNELGDRYPPVLTEHRRALRQAFGNHGGVEVDTQGDAFFVVSRAHRMRRRRPTRHSARSRTGPSAFESACTAGNRR
jgi:class 3 adenylate cyclase